jgi:hypothetical protein
VDKIYYDKNGILYRDAVFSDVKELASRLRKEDLEEVLLIGQTPEEALEFSFNSSSIAIAITYKGIIAGMFGLSPVSLMGDNAIVWQLTAPEVELFKVTFAKLSKRFIDMLLEYYPILENRWVDARYTKAIGWLKWCGAEITPKSKFVHAIIRRR